MIGLRDASGIGSTFISGRFDRRLDEPSATPNHRILRRGKSRPEQIGNQRCGSPQSALPSCRASQKDSPVKIGM
jgi:hypothetical protein